MTPAQRYFAAAASGMDIIATMPSVTLRTPEARELTRLHDVYFGTTKFTRKQARARKTLHSLAAIRALEAKLRGLKEIDRWAIREELLAMDLTVSQIAAEAKQRADALKDKPVKDHGVKIRRSKDDTFEIKITGTSEDITDMKHALGDTIESAKKCLFGEDKATRTAKQTNVIIMLDELVEVMDGNGAETMFRMTNGAVIPGAQLVQEKLLEAGLFTLVHPFYGPVNLYRTDRTANLKQRLMAWAENPTCAWPGCYKPAEESEIHHIHAWKHGGHTNPDNLVTLCKHHNGANNDDPTKPSKRGRMERIRGKTEWSPPWGIPI